MVKQITIDKPTKPNLFAPDDALITTSTTAVDFVTDDLEKLAVELISNNELRVKSGVFCIGGHYGYVPSGTFETCFISPGNMGFKRKDLIVARYTRVGNLDYIGVQIYTGVPTKGVPVVPSLTVSDLNTGGKIREIALHTVELVDMNIVNVEQMFSVPKTKEDIFRVVYNSPDYVSVYTGDIATEYIHEGKSSSSAVMDIAKDGVFVPSGHRSVYATIEPGYSASEIVAFASVVNSGIYKININSVSTFKIGGIRKIEINYTPYAFVSSATVVQLDRYFTIRYKKIKL